MDKQNRAIPAWRDPQEIIISEQGDRLVSLIYVARMMGMRLDKARSSLRRFCAKMTDSDRSALFVCHEMRVRYRNYAKTFSEEYYRAEVMLSWVFWLDPNWRNPRSTDLVNTLRDRIPDLGRFMGLPEVAAALGTTNNRVLESARRFEARVIRSDSKIWEAVSKDTPWRPYLVGPVWLAAFTAMTTHKSAEGMLRLTGHLLSLMQRVSAAPALAQPPALASKDILEKLDRQNELLIKVLANTEQADGERRQALSRAAVAETTALALQDAASKSSQQAQAMSAQGVVPMMNMDVMLPPISAAAVRQQGFVSRRDLFTQLTAFCRAQNKESPKITIFGTWLNYLMYHEYRDALNEPVLKADVVSRRYATRLRVFVPEHVVIATWRKRCEEATTRGLPTPKVHEVQNWRWATFFSQEGVNWVLTRYAEGDFLRWVEAGRPQAAKTRGSGKESPLVLDEQ